MTEAEAARELGIRVAQFRHLVACGRLPKPLDEFEGRFDMKAVHAAIDRISGIGSATNALERWKETRQCGSS